MNQASSVLRITKALADLQRLRIVSMLERGELCVCQIVEVLDLAPSTVSKHLTVLAGAGLVESRKEGRWAYYRLAGQSTDEAVRRALEWVKDAVESDDALAQDAETLDRVLQEDPEVVAKRQRLRG